MEQRTWQMLFAKVRWAIWTRHHKLNLWIIHQIVLLRGWGNSVIISLICKVWFPRVCIHKILLLKWLPMIWYLMIINHIYKHQFQQLKKAWIWEMLIVQQLFSLKWMQKVIKVEWVVPGMEIKILLKLMNSKIITKVEEFN